MEAKNLLNFILPSTVIQSLTFMRISWDFHSSQQVFIEVTTKANEKGPLLNQTKAEFGMFFILP